MSLQITIQVNDRVTPALRALAATMQNLTPVNRSIGVALAALAKRAFDEPGLRPSAWPAKRDGSTATLRRSGMLWRSVRVTGVTPQSVSLGSDRPYAAIHQLGGQTPARVITARRARALSWPGAAHPVRSVHHPGSRIPARPFFPVTAGGQLTEQARAEMERRPLAGAARMKRLAFRGRRGR